MINISSLIFIILTLTLLIIILFNYHKIPTRDMHINRNKNNIYPVGKLTLIKNNQYIDDNNIIWIKRPFLNSLFHKPFSQYVFETLDNEKISSSETEINIQDFDSNSTNFLPASFNYYSSFNYPISHFFADVLPILLYLIPKYDKY